MDKELNRLRRLDWSQVEPAGRVTVQSSRLLGARGPLRELVDHALGDPALLELSERQWWGDRIILFDDPDSMLRIRLHRFDAGTHLPHSHRWAFHTRILSGSYVHRIYGPEQGLDRSAGKAAAALVPGVVRVEEAGSSYILDQHTVHSVSPSHDTFSLVIQGPRLKEYSVRTGPDGSLIWKGGRARESQQAISSTRLTADRLQEVRELAHRQGLLDQ